MTDYRNETIRFVDVGLDLRDSSDKVGVGQWVRLENVNSPQEGLLETRDGRNLSISTGENAPVHSLKRLGGGTVLVGVGENLYRNGTLITGGFSGNPLSIVPAQPALASATWGYIGDSAQLRKVREDGTNYKWGITGPTNPASFAASAAAGNLDSSAPGATVYDYRYTYYSTITGAESNPSPTADGVAIVAKKGSISVDASLDVQVDQIRIYRRGGLNGGDEWRFSISTTNTAQTIEDNNADDDIALNESLSLDKAVPFTSVDSNGNTLTEVPLPYVTGPFIGKYLLACGDSNRPGYVYWTNPEDPDSSAAENNVQVTPPQEPLQGVLTYAAVPYSFSKEDLYVLDFGGPTAIPTFIPRRTSVGLGVVGPRAFCVGPMIYFVNRRGIYETNGSETNSITEESLRPLFRGEAVSNFFPIDFTQEDEIRLFYAGEELHFCYVDTNGVNQHLSWHLLYKRWKSFSSDLTDTTYVYLDENQSITRLYIGGDNGNVYESVPSATTDAGSTISVNVRTGSMDFSAPQTFKEFGNIIVDADPNGGTISVTPYLDAESTTLATQTLTGSGRQKFPLSLSDTYSHSIALDFSWEGLSKIYQVDFLWRMDEEAIKHWEFPPTTNGGSGWQHVRDAYITLRSTATVTFTVEVDGVAYAYALSSTGGEKRKVYVQLRPVKGKVFRYSLDSTSPFRIYGDDCEIRVKLWNTSLGYKLVSPFIKMGSDGSRG